MFPQMLTTMKALFKSWYAVDRIRIFPTTGRLLSLNVGNSILLRDQFYTVQERRIHGDEAHQQAVFHLVHSDGDATLTVSLIAGNGGEGRLARNGETSIVFECDVVVRQSSGTS